MERMAMKKNRRGEARPVSFNLNARRVLRILGQRQLYHPEVPLQVGVIATSDSTRGNAQLMRGRHHELAVAESTVS